jgi:hypothetical protein
MIEVLVPKEEEEEVKCPLKFEMKSETVSSSSYNSYR